MQACPTRGIVPRAISQMAGPVACLQMYINLLEIGSIPNTGNFATGPLQPRYASSFLNVSNFSLKFTDNSITKLKHFR